MNYQHAVAQNMKHMGSHTSEWTAIDVIGTEETETGTGSRLVPVFDFPSGYSKAPSLYQGECCNLCGTDIRNVYWIKNDLRQWTMAVGNECVTKFGDGESGEALAKQSLQQINASLLEQAIAARRGIWQAYAKRNSLGYGRYETRINNHAAGQMHQDLKACIGKVRLDSGKAAITRWANRNAERARELLEHAKAYLPA
jgi:hypothetical protein|tara:strand:- start:24 stop:617 length:594 start_codon:yes stop_codon:yes gene_type:complete